MNTTDILESRALTINETARDAHSNATAHGFYDNASDLLAALIDHGDARLFDSARRDFVLAQIAKVASECGEAVAVIQHDEGDERLAEEFADIIIRVLDLSDWLKLDVGHALTSKMQRNASRPRLHGKTC